MGSIHRLTGYIPHLAQTAAVLRRLIKTQQKIKHWIGKRSMTHISQDQKNEFRNNTK